MLDRTPSLEKEKAYDRGAGDTIPLGGLHRLGKAVGSCVEMGHIMSLLLRDVTLLLRAQNRIPWICRGPRFIRKGRS